MTQGTRPPRGPHPDELSPEFTEENPAPSGGTRLLRVKATRLPRSTPAPLDSSRELFRPEWHDAKEIIVPFDASKYDVQFAKEEEWAAAYTHAPVSRPASESLRLDTRRVVGRLVDPPGLRDDIMGLLSGVVVFTEVMVFAWAVVLLWGWPISKWLAWPIATGWATSLVGLRFVLKRPWTSRAFLWLGGVSSTLLWLKYPPSSHPFATMLDSLLSSSP